MAKTSLGLETNISAFLCYLLGWVSGLIIILIEKNDAFVRFHAMQSIITFGILSILSILFSSMFFFLGFALSLINLLGIALWILLMIKAYQGEKFMLPVIGEIAEDWSNKI
jgi:uncharacterized membrane protein